MTKKTTITVNETPIIVIESIGEDVRIRGHELPEIVISAEDGSIDYEVQPANQEDGAEKDNSEAQAKNNDSDATSEASDNTGDVLEDESDNVVKIGPISGDGMIDLPFGSRLRIGKIGGDAQIRSVRGDIQIESVGEDLSATKIGTITVKSVGGDASLKRASGGVSIDNVGEDASCSDIEGDLTVNVGSDLSLTAIQGNLNAKVGEDAILRFPLVEGRQYNVIASGDISCYLPSDTNAEVMLRSGTRTLRVRGWEIPPPTEEELYTFTLGEGGASLNLNAGEDIAMLNQESNQGSGIDFDFDFDFGPGFQFRFDSDSGFRPEQFSNLFSEKIQEKVQSAMRQAEESIANAISHAESRISNAERRATDFESKWTGHGGRGSKNRRRERPAEDRRRREAGRRGRRRNHDHSESAAPKGPTVTEAERTMVLQMVADGKISVEQAEKLLSAMGS